MRLEFICQSSLRRPAQGACCVPALVNVSKEREMLNDRGWLARTEKGLRLLVWPNSNDRRGLARTRWHKEWVRTQRPRRCLHCRGAIKAGRPSVLECLSVMFAPGAGFRVWLGAGLPACVSVCPRLYPGCVSVTCSFRTCVWQLSHQIALLEQLRSF